MLAIQLVNYRTRTFLEKCLATVVSDLQRDGLDHEINLLDNDSGESLADLAARIPRCRAFDAPRNLGFGAGHNLLADMTTAPNLLVLNPDVEFLEPGSARRLLKSLERSDRIKAVGPRLVAPDG